MKQSDAYEYCRILMLGLQRARSIGRESYNADEFGADFVEKFLEFLTPWLHGQKGDGFLRGVILVVERGSVEKGEFYNFMYILDTLAPELGATVDILCDADFPKPDIEWIRKGFEK